LGSFHDSGRLAPVDPLSENPEQEERMRASQVVMLGAIAVLAVAAAAATATVALTRGGDDPPPPVTEHVQAIPNSARTVLVSRAMPMPSAHARTLSAMLEEGAMPNGPTTAEVMTDSDCTPDAQMISRCRNVVRLANGRTIVLRHPHNMTKVPCLAPGERVRLLPTDV
jgi:hypothetical protein